MDEREHIAIINGLFAYEVLAKDKKSN